MSLGVLGVWWVLGVKKVVGRYFMTPETHQTPKTSRLFLQMS